MADDLHELLEVSPAVVLAGTDPYDFARDEWRFSSAVAGPYYLVVRAQTSGQSYSFTFASTR